MRATGIDTDYLLDQLLRLLAIPSPTGYTDNIVHHLVDELRALQVPYELTRRGAVRAMLEGREAAPKRALVAHVDTLGAMVSALRPNGRPALSPIGTWSARFAEGARCTVFGEKGARRATILPLMASGHAYDSAIDTQPVSWDNLELRIDAICDSRDDLERLGVNVGDFVAIDTSPEVTPEGFINARHLDDKAGVAVLLAAVKALRDEGQPLPVDAHLLFTISEEVGSGASTILHGDVAEMLAVDNATPAPGQNSTEHGVTIAMKDSTGPFDYHLSRMLVSICEDARIPFRRDVFRHYRCDVASAVEAGNDIRTGLACFGVDASHGYERTHVDSLRSLAQLLVLYLRHPPVAWRDRMDLGPVEGFPTQPEGPTAEEIGSSRWTSAEGS